MAFTGTLTNINTAVGRLTYKPDEDFNTRQHAELLTVAVSQAASSEAKVSLKWSNLPDRRKVTASTFHNKAYGRKTRTLEIIILWKCRSSAHPGE